jgi:hypothetical protein
MELFNQQPVQIPLGKGQLQKFYVDLSKYSSATHVVFQAHAQWYQLNVSFASAGSKVDGQFAVGTNVGLVSLLKRGDPVKFVVTSASHPDLDHINILVVASVYKSSGM